MSGPIVRSGPSPEFSKNWEQVFGKPSGTAASADKAPQAKQTGVKAAKPAKKKKGS